MTSKYKEYVINTGGTSSASDHIPIQIGDYFYSDYPWFPDDYDPFKPYEIPSYGRIYPVYVPKIVYYITSNFTVRKFESTEFPDKIELKLKVPGFNSNNIEVYVEGDRLTVIGKNASETLIEDYTFKHDVYNYDASTSTIVDGILTIVVPKLDKTKVKYIPVTGGKSPVFYILKKEENCYFPLFYLTIREFLI